MPPAEVVQVRALSSALDLSLDRRSCVWTSSSTRAAGFAPLRDLDRVEVQVGRAAGEALAP